MKPHAIADRLEGEEHGALASDAEEEIDGAGVGRVNRVEALELGVVDGDDVDLAGWDSGCVHGAGSLPALANSARRASANSTDHLATS